VIAVWKLDRFVRSVKHVVVALSECESLGIAFVSLKDNLDLTTPSGRFMFQIIAAFGELERAIIAERVRAGLQNARRRGKKLGRHIYSSGQSQNSPLRASGASIRAISAQLEISPATVHKVITAVYSTPPPGTILRQCLCGFRIAAREQKGTENILTPP
jgi:DNA invertase Pin-like site-specific DNA recombinase